MATKEAAAAAAENNGKGFSPLSTGFSKTRVNGQCVSQPDPVVNTWLDRISSYVHNFYSIVATELVYLPTLLVTFTFFFLFLFRTLFVKIRNVQLSHIDSRSS